MEFTFSPSFAGDMTVSHLPGPHKDASLVICADATIQSSSYGAILRQQETGKEYTYLWHHLRIRADCMLDMVTLRTQVLLCYLVRGELSCALEGTTRKEGSFQLYYVTEGRRSFAVPAGEYTLFQIVLELKDLVWIAARCPRMEDIKLLMMEQSSTAACRYGGVISKAGKSQIRNLGGNRLKCLERQIEIDKCILNLKLEYLKGLTAKKKLFKPRHRTGDLGAADLKELMEGLASHKNDKTFFKRFAEAKNMSYRKLLDTVQSITGVPAGVYKKGERRERAVFLVKDTDLPMLDIAIELGFSETAPFSTWFGQQCGHTPTAFRKMHRA